MIKVSSFLMFAVGCTMIGWSAPGSEFKTLLVGVAMLVISVRMQNHQIIIMIENKLKELGR